jgi:ABC-type multidrug transport system fused ATPase/permease subunit
MSRFYFLLWFRWALRLSINSILWAVIISLLVCLVTYVKLGLVELDAQVFDALWDIFKFSFAIAFSFTLLLFLFRSIKYIFNRCLGGYELKLLSCDKQKTIDHIGYGDLVKVWRRWFMLLIWLVAVCMIITMFNFFNIYALYIFVLISGYFSFIIMVSRCTKVKVVRC